MPINIERALATTGYMSPVELTYLAEAASKSKSIVEIGCWLGRSACALAVNTTGVVFAVDVWGGSFDYYPDCQLDPAFFSTFLANTRGLDNLWPVPMPSLRAAALMKASGITFDFIFIDGTHSAESLTADILAWKPLLRDGGIFSGHDFGFENTPDVKTVVDSMIQKFRLVETIWTTEGCE